MTATNAPQEPATVIRDRAVIARPTTRIPLAVAGGRGAVLVDTSGRQIIDLTSGWNVVNTGWNHPRIVSALHRQIDQLSFSPPWCTHEGRVRVGERLNTYLGGEWKALCGATGSEAVEAALKVARRATGRKAVVGFTQAYHGGTLGAMLAGGVPDLHGKDIPSDDTHRHAPIPDGVRNRGRDYAQEARAVILAEPHPAAVLLEPVFTNPGVLHGDETFYETVYKSAKEVGAVLIVDEVGTGFGRTGRMFGFEHWPMQPDIIVVAKALTSGAVPMAAAVMRSDLAQAISGPGFSSTFGWTPLACAAAEETLNVIDEEGLVERARLLGLRSLSLLGQLVENCPHVAAVRGKGLEIGVELVGPDNAPLTRPHLEALTRRLMARNVFAEPSSFTSTLLIMPPLVITEEQLDSALGVVIEEVSAMNLEEG